MQNYSKIRKSDRFELTAVTTLFVLIFAVGCKTESNSDQQEPVAPATSAAALVGNWGQGCKKSKLTQPTWQTSQANISATTVSYLFRQYSDQNCTTLTGVELAGSATYTVGELVTSVSGARAIDTVPKSLTIKPNDQTTVNNFNQMSYCGNCNWVLGVAQNAASCRNSDGTLAMAPSYSIFKVVGDVYFPGKSDKVNDESTPAKRATTIDVSENYTRNSK